MKILVTGGAGFIGSHLCEALLADDNQVVCFDYFTNSVNQNFKWDNLAIACRDNNFMLYDGDLRSLSNLQSVFNRCQFDAVMHLAGQTGVRPSVQDPKLHYTVNVLGTLSLLQLCVVHDVKKLIFASSSSIYGNNPNVPFKETDKADTQLSPYAASKKAVENLLYVFHKLYNMDITCIRPFTVYGPRQRKEMAISLFTRLLNENKKITIFGDETNRRDYTYVSDVVSGFISALRHVNGYNIYNVGGANPIDLGRLISIIENELGKKAELDHSPMQPGEAIQTYADITKAHNELGYTPKVRIEEGIKRFVKWYLSNAV